MFKKQYHKKISVKMIFNDLPKIGDYKEDLFFTLTFLDTRNLMETSSSLDEIDAFFSKLDSKRIDIIPAFKIINPTFKNFSYIIYSFLKKYLSENNCDIINFEVKNNDSCLTKKDLDNHYFTYKDFSELNSIQVFNSIDFTNETETYINELNELNLFFKNKKNQTRFIFKYLFLALFCIVLFVAFKMVIGDIYDFFVSYK